MGELVAFTIGWDLILEYGVSVAAVAVGWGGNVNAFLDSAFNVRIPGAISTSPSDGGVFNLPAVFIVMAITFLLVRGTRESATANMVPSAGTPGGPHGGARHPSGPGPGGVAAVRGGVATGLAAESRRRPRDRARRARRERQAAAGTGRGRALGPDLRGLRRAGVRFAGYGPVRRVLLGGVSSRVVRHSRVPVILTPRGD